MCSSDHKGLRPLPGLLLVLLALSLFATAAFAQKDDSTAEQTLADCPIAGYIMGLRYQQKSAEIKALQIQSYNLATMRLKQILASDDAPKNPAIVTDLDETAIDNTALLARDLLACHDYTAWDTWLKWEQYGDPKAIPGAVAFFKYADAHGVDVYYVSGRAKDNKKDTMASLKKLGFPQVTDDHVYLVFYGPAKSKIRKEITDDGHNIIMLLGDSLADLSGIFEDKSVPEQRQAVMDNADHFGHDWIVFPNASYGSWSDTTLDSWDRPIQPGDGDQDE